MTFLQLVEAFHATLEEVVEADLLVVCRFCIEIFPLCSGFFIVRSIKFVLPSLLIYFMLYIFDKNINFDRIFV